MLKIIKYEFRKSRTSLLVMLLIAAGLYLLAPAGKLLHREELMAISLLLLLFYAFAAFIYALVRGITAYSGELRGKTGYMLMLVPRSTMSILFGKLLFSMAFAALMLAVSALALGSSFAICFDLIYGETGYDVRTAIDVLRFAMRQVGVNPAHMAATVLCYVVEILSAILALVGISYLSVTLSATILQEGRGRGFFSFLFFIALSILTGWLEDRLLLHLSPSVLYFVVDILSAALALVFIVYLSVAISAAIFPKGRARGIVTLLIFVALLLLAGGLKQWTAPMADELSLNFNPALRRAQPATILSLALTCAYTAASALLLKEKVNL